MLPWGGAPCNSIGNPLPRLQITLSLASGSAQTRQHDRVAHQLVAPQTTKYPAPTDTRRLVAAKTETHAGVQHFSCCFLAWISLLRQDCSCAGSGHLLADVRMALLPEGGDAQRDHQGLRQQLLQHNQVLGRDGPALQQPGLVMAFDAVIAFQLNVVHIFDAEMEAIQAC